MKKYLLFVIVTLSLSIMGLVTTASAQFSGSRSTGAVTSEESGKADRASQAAEIQEILARRAAGSLAPDDACTNRPAITLAAPVTGALASDDCLIASTNTFIDFYDFQGTAGQAIAVSQVSSAFDTYLYIYDSGNNVLQENDDSGGISDSRIPVDFGVVTLPYTGHYTIGANSYNHATGAYTLSITSPSTCASKSIFFNQSPTGSLTTSSCAINIDDQAFYTDIYTFSASAGKQISVTLTSSAFDAYLVMHTPSGTNSTEDDDSGGGSNSRIPASGLYTLPETGIYTIEASSFDPAAIGSYTLNITGPAGFSISGRATSPSGVGLRNAVVTLVDAAGVQRTATTSSFGFYTFTDVAPGANYTVRVVSRLYRFSPRTLQVNDDVANVDFTGLE